MRKAISLLLLTMIVIPTLAQSALGVGLHQAENNANITYSGCTSGAPFGWTTVSDGANTYRNATTKNCLMSFSFIGKAILIYRNLIWTVWKTSENQGSSAGTHSIGNIGTLNNRRAQTFVPSKIGRIARFFFNFGANTGSPTGAISWQLQTTAGTPPQPTGVVLNSGTFTAVPNGWADTGLITNGSILQAGTTYAVVLFANQATAGNAYNWSYTSTSPTGQVNWRSTNNGATWAQSTPNNAAIFEVFQYASPDIEACLNGVCSTISNWSSTEQYGVPFGLIAPTQGTHTVTVKTLDDYSNVGNWQVDSILVLDEQTQGGNTVIPIDIQLEVTEEPDPAVVRWDVTDSGNNTQPVRFDYAMTAGDVMVSLLMVALIVLIIAQLVVSLIQWKR